MPDDDVRFSRNGTTHPLGKCDTRLDVPMPEELRDRIAAVAIVSGKTAGEWVRDELEKLIDGELVFMRRRMPGRERRGDGMKE